MLYRSDSPRAVYAMECDRLGDYEENPEYCPECGYADPMEFYKDSAGVCVGCCECIARTNTLRDVNLR